MSDDWFDKTYRSNETPPAELDARVLSAARSAVRRRRFPGAAVVAGAGRTVRRRPLLAVAGTAVAAATAAFVALPVLDRSGFELPPPQAEPELALERSFMHLATPETETLGAASEMESPEAAIAETASAGASGLPETLVVLPPTAVPVEAPPPPVRKTTAGAPARRELVVTRLAAPAAACIPNVLRGPLGGPGRADEAHWCPDGRGGLEIDFVWDGGAPCPSRLVVEDAANVRAVLDGNVLVAGRARYRCIEGRWARIE